MSTTTTPATAKPSDSVDKAKKSLEVDGQPFPVVRQHVLLRNGTTVAIDDYEPAIHGKQVEESDDQYLMRIGSAPNGRPSSNIPMTTIPNLQSADAQKLFDSSRASAAQPITPAIAPAVVGSPVVTEESKAAEEKK